MTGTASTGAGEADDRVGGGDGEEHDHGAQLQRPAVHDGGEEVAVELLHGDCHHCHDNSRPGPTPTAARAPLTKGAAR